MKNWSFALVTAIVVLVCFTAMAFHYRFQVAGTVHPFLVVYRDSVTLPDSHQPNNVRYWTTGVRSDGSVVKVNAVPDTTGKFPSVARAIEFENRYVIVDPSTESITSYKPRQPLIAPTKDCGGKDAGSILGYRVELVQDVVRAPKEQSPRSTSRTRWLAINLNCVPLREQIALTDENGKTTNFRRDAVRVNIGEPSAELFDVPPSYQERSPADLNKEFERRHPGQNIFGNKESIDHVQQQYNQGKLD